MLGLVVIVLLATAAVLAPLIDRYDPSFQDYDAVRQGPSWDHWFGTDALGRDQWSRVVHGARLSLGVALLATSLAVSIGIMVGMMAGLGGRRADNLLMRGTDVAYAFPDLLMLILIISVLGSNFAMIFIAIGLVSWTTMARLVRGQALSLQRREFVIAATALGAGRLRIAFTHMLPNLAGPVIVAAVFSIPFAIFAEAALAYIGLGLAPPASSWGLLVTGGYTAVRTSPHLLLFPVLAIAVTMVSLTFIGDGLRDAFDPRQPRLRRRGE
jgi:oligopeptide transport system permease protein